MVVGKTAMTSLYCHSVIVQSGAVIIQKGGHAFLVQPQKNELLKSTSVIDSAEAHSCICRYKMKLMSKYCSFLSNGCSIAHQFHVVALL